MTKIAMVDLYHVIGMAKNLTPNPDDEVYISCSTTCSLDLGLSDR